MTAYFQSRREHRVSGIRRRCRLRLEALEMRALLSVCTVDRLTDTGEGGGLRGDLRYCITQVNELPGDDTITFEVSGEISVTAGSGLPHLSSNIDMQGPGAHLLTVVRRTYPGFVSPIFTVSANASVALTGLSLHVPAGFGRAISNDGELTVLGCVTTGNRAGAGGIDNAGTLTVLSSTITAGSARMGGGGIYNRGSLILSDSDVSDNWYRTDGGTQGGGGIRNSGTMLLTNSTVSNNQAVCGVRQFCSMWRGGGGIDNSGVLTVSNSTISGNSTTSAGSNPPAGGGVFNSGQLIVSNSTITQNRAARGGGILAGTMTARNTVISGNTAPLSPDVSGDLGSLGYNLIGNTSGGSGFHKTDLLNVDPRLGPLADNGGPTWTHALLPGSPALDAGDNTDAPEFDQRGRRRIVNGTIDIGAYERQRVELRRVAVVDQPFGLGQRAGGAAGPVLDLFLTDALEAGHGPLRR